MSSRLSRGHTELSKYADLKLILKLGGGGMRLHAVSDKFRAWVLGKEIQEITLWDNMTQRSSFLHLL